MRTNLGKLGVPPHIAELAINHIKGGVQAIYDRHRYQREIRRHWRFGLITCSRLPRVVKPTL